MDEWIVLVKKQCIRCNDENENGERKRLSMSEWGCIDQVSVLSPLRFVLVLEVLSRLESSEWACLRNCLMRMILLLQKQFKDLVL